MQSIKPVLLSIILIFTSLSAHADVLVLVHGWRANADSWQHSGVQAVLNQQGWQNGGIISSSRGRIEHYQQTQVSADKTSYRASLPEAAPMQLQASHLLAQLQYIAGKHPNEKLTLVGHSAGGIVARLALIHRQAPKIDKFISIATPHLGTPRALQGLNVADSKPFFCPGPGIDFLKTVVGGNDYRYLKHSRPALADLNNRTSQLIPWLNRQTHPAIEYHAIIKHGDEIIPPASQDLRQVAVIGKQAKAHMTRSSHGLNPQDGILLSRILD